MLSQLVDFDMHLPVTDPTWIFFHRAGNHTVCPNIVWLFEDTAHHRNDSLPAL